MSIFFSNTALRFILHTPQHLERWSYYNDDMPSGA